MNEDFDGGSFDGELSFENLKKITEVNFFPTKTLVLERLKEGKTLKWSFNPENFRLKIWCLDDPSTSQHIHRAKEETWSGFTGNIIVDSGIPKVYLTNSPNSSTIKQATQLKNLIALSLGLS